MKCHLHRFFWLCSQMSGYHISILGPTYLLGWISFFNKSFTSAKLSPTTARNVWVLMLEFHAVCYLNLLPTFLLFSPGLSWLLSQLYIPFLFLRTPTLFLYLFFRNPWEPSGWEYPLSLFCFLRNVLCSAVMMEEGLSSGSTVPHLRPFLASWIVWTGELPVKTFMPGQQDAWDFSVNLKSLVTLYSLKVKARRGWFNFTIRWFKETVKIWRDIKAEVELYFVAACYFSVPPRGYSSLLHLTKKASSRLHPVGIQSLDVTCPGDVPCPGGCPSLRRVFLQNPLAIWHSFPPLWRFSYITEPRA